ncbi:PH domain-containing protein [Streptomyces sp. DH12]|uniref:PH domain-containing protein n=1 Tax=Streptomyces sp. DH12 TaxID=2857010 RepID=UPI001E2988D3|nr:PH domain-containing protein [Streptomyces sp. DH12]
MGEPGGEDSRAEARRAKRARVALLAASATAPPEPVRWGAGWGGRVCGAVVFAVYVASVHRPEGAGLARPEPGAFLFALWTSLVLAWAVCRLALWRVTADRDGIHVRRMWSTRLLAWPVVGRVDLRHDGVLECFGPRGSTLFGTFAPPWLARLARRDCPGQRAADLLTAMSLHPHLRPTGRVPRRAARAGFARWALPLGALVHAAPFLLRP